MPAAASRTLEYAPNAWLTLRIGCRGLDSNLQAGSDLGFNVHMKGQIVAGTSRF